jgi:hypothetical protein
LKPSALGETRSAGAYANNIRQQNHYGSTEQVPIIQEKAKRRPSYQTTLIEATSSWIIVCILFLPLLSSLLASEATYSLKQVFQSVDFNMSLSLWDCDALGIEQIPLLSSPSSLMRCLDHDDYHVDFSLDILHSYPFSLLKGIEVLWHVSDLSSEDFQLQSISADIGVIAYRSKVSLMDPAVNISSSEERLLLRLGRSQMNEVFALKDSSEVKLQPHIRITYQRNRLSIAAPSSRLIANFDFIVRIPSPIIIAAETCCLTLWSIFLVYMIGCWILWLGYQLSSPNNDDETLSQGSSFTDNEDIGTSSATRTKTSRYAMIRAEFYYALILLLSAHLCFNPIQLIDDMASMVLMLIFPLDDIKTMHLPQFLSRIGIILSSFASHGMLFAILCILESLRYTDQNDQIASSALVRGYIDSSPINSNHRRRYSSETVEHPPLWQNLPASSTTATALAPVAPESSAMSWYSNQSRDSSGYGLSVARTPSRRLDDDEASTRMVAGARRANHPWSSYWADFIVKKTLYLLLCWTMELLILYLLLSFTPSSSPSSMSVATVIVVSWVDELIYLLWMLWIIIAAAKLNRELSATKYMCSRFQQLVNRVLRFQLTLAILVICCYLILTAKIVNTSIWMNQMLLQIDQLLSRGDWKFVSMLGAVADDSWFMIFAWSYLMMMTLTWIAMISPYRSSSINGKDEHLLHAHHRHSIIALERNLPHHLVAGSSFCLETACKLMETSFQSYFHIKELGSMESNNPQQPLSSSLSSNGELDYDDEELIASKTCIDPRRLGLRLVAQINNPSTRIAGFLGIRQHMDVDPHHASRQVMIICFRGSVRANMAMDMNFQQIPLIELRCESDYWRSLIDEEFHRLHFSSPPPTSRSASPSPEKELPQGISHGEIESLPSMSPAANPPSTFIRCLQAIPILKQSLARVHCGFWNGYASIRAQYHHALIRELLQPFAAAAKMELQFCGHSLGGSLAVFAALDLAMNLKSIRKYLQRYSVNKQQIWNPHLMVYTYGSPRIGNAVFARLLKQHIPDVYRVEVDRDLIARLPLGFGGAFYKHAGNRVLVDSNQVGNLLVKPTLLETRLWTGTISSGGGFASLTHHKLSRYRRCLEACFTDDELREYLRSEMKTLTSHTTSASAEEMRAQRMNMVDWMMHQRGTLAGHV